MVKKTTTAKLRNLFFYHCLCSCLFVCTKKRMPMSILFVFDFIENQVLTLQG